MPTRNVNLTDHYDRFVEGLIASGRYKNASEVILAWTHEEFGEKARRRYEALLTRAILDGAESPERAGSHDRPEIAPEARTYHLRHSRDRVRKSTGRVQRPRHFLLYRTSDD